MTPHADTNTPRRAYPGLEFVDFGANDALGAHVFRLRVSQSTGKASLVEDYGSLNASAVDEPEKTRVQVPVALWKSVAGYVQKDFNARLKEKGYKVGKWKNEGEVLIDRLLGRELALLLWAIEDLDPSDHTRLGAAVRAWQAYRPEERWWLSAQVGDGNGDWRRAVKVAMAKM